MTSLENEYLRVSIRPKGAELTSIVNKAANLEHLWQADPAVWNWHAPNLFPVVGGCLNNQLLIDGNAYPMERHGFARQSVFTVAEATPTRAVFSLRSSAATAAVYPYEFDFQVIYTLDGPQLHVTYRVENLDRRTMYFSVGAHPAFAVPFFMNEEYDDYYLLFDADDALDTHQLSKAGYFTGETRPVPLSNRQLRLTADLFDQDALVFKTLNSRRVTIKSDNHHHEVVVDFPAFPYLGIWAKPGAPFVCLEPWLGCADSEGEPRPIDEKEAIQQVGAGAVFDATFTITIR